MDSTEFLTYRIIRGHLGYSRGGLYLYIEDPNPEMMYESFEVYNEYYNKAYNNGVYIKEEILEYLYQKDLYSPFDDMELKKLQDEIESLKLDAYKNFINTRQLKNIKFNIRIAESKMSSILKKKAQLDHITCEGVASLAQWSWIIENSTYDKKTNQLYDFSKIKLSEIVSYYEEHTITSSNFRAIARGNHWRPIWNVGKKNGNLFNKPAALFTKDQIALCSYSLMYDNVYESPDSPPDKVIEDDDCLDGWFIEQRKKTDQYKKEKAAEDIIGNKKIANSQEIFIMAGSKEEADYIDSFNDPTAKMIKDQRLKMFSEKGTINSDSEFLDIKMERQMEMNRNLIERSRGK